MQVVGNGRPLSLKDNSKSCNMLCNFSLYTPSKPETFMKHNSTSPCLTWINKQTLRRVNIDITLRLLGGQQNYPSDLPKNFRYDLLAVNY